MNKELWSCNDIQGSIYFAPSEIRACCKRFFVGEKRKGDVPLFQIEGPKKFEFQDIVNARTELIHRVNSNKESEGSGCPYLEKKVWGEPTQVKHISIEHHSICNLKCTYCSDTYYGGDYAQYDILNVLESIVAHGNILEMESLVWGGGEPFLDKQKDKIFDLLYEVSTQNPRIDLRVFSNSIRFEERCKELIDEERIFLTTSIDAGTQGTYLKIRGKSKILDVFSNLRKYAQSKPKRITVKYIFTQGNCSADEVIEFVKLVQDFGLTDCNFQLSIDFNFPKLLENHFAAIVQMASLLQELKVGGYFLDDLIYLRIREFYRNNPESINNILKAFPGKTMLAPMNLEKPVTIWGAGFIGRKMVENSLFAQTNQIEFFVDKNFHDYENSDIFGLKILNPEKLTSNDNYILIASSQKYQEIMFDLESLGIDKDRIVRGIVV